MANIRTFVAVEVSPVVRQRAAELVKRLRTSGDGFKWVDPASMHLTLSFLGDVDDRDVYRVCQAVSTAVATVPPFDIEFAGAGAFPDVPKPRTVWIGVTHGAEQMIALQEAVADALEVEGYRKESRRYQPHLTIGRCGRGSRPTRELSQQIAAAAEFEVGESGVDEVVVFSSRLERAGPVYEALSTAPLAGSL